MAKKTNAVRLVEQAKIPCREHFYEFDENDLSGLHAAEALGRSPEEVFKTLVAKGDKTGHLVFCIPVDREIDLKAAAALTGNKKIEMVHVKDLLGLTGYIRGGCSPIGMKKKLPTYFDATAAEHERITVSAGIKGAQMLVEREVLVRFVDGRLIDVAR